MNKHRSPSNARRWTHTVSKQRIASAARTASLALLMLGFASAAHASPFDSGISSIQTLFTGTIARAASLIAIVVGGFGFAFGDPGAKKNLMGIAMGTGIAILATNVLSWLWGS